MNTANYKAHKRAVRHRRLRSKVNGTAQRPRLSVFKSNNNIYAQLIDDTAAHTLASSDSRAFPGTPAERATAVGKDIAEKAKSQNLESVVFDRGGFRYQGNVAALATSVREQGINV